MEKEIVKEAIKRIRGLPTTSRVRKELTEKFTLTVSKEELEGDLKRMVEEGEIEERFTTIKGNRFKGYKLPEREEEREEEEEEKTEEEKIIEDIFG